MSEDQVFCSFIIPTIGRVSLARSVQSVLDQRFTKSDWEVIVVNDSGSPLVPAGWQEHKRVRIIETNRRERNFARNSGAAVARGQYLGFLDDDDWLLPDALGQYWEISQYAPEAVWLYGGLQIVDENENTIAEANSGLSGNCTAQIIGGAWAPIQSSIISAAAFLRLGGYNPLILGTEDIDLCCRAAMHGDFANTSAMVACLQRGKSWNTSTDYSRATEDTRNSRDMVLSSPGALTRMLQSTQDCFWRGRILHSYLSAGNHNLRQGRSLTALSRFLSGFHSLLRSGQCLFTTKYWQAVRDDHVPGSLHHIMQDYEAKLRLIAEVNSLIGKVE